MPKILDYAKFCEDLDEITSLKMFGKKKFTSDGLFSEQIFGPLRNYTCQCGKYHGVSKVGGKCDSCGVDIINSDERRKRFAKIKLPFPVVNPLFYDLLVELGGKQVKKALDDLMKNDKSIFYILDEEFVVTTDDNLIPEGIQTWQRTDAIYEFVKQLTEDAISLGLEEWKIIQDSLDSLLIDQIIVLPPDLRPISKSSMESKQLKDQITTNYVSILTKKEIMKDTIIDIYRDKALYYTYYKQLQQVVNELYTKILEKMAKKEGLIRGNILGKRIDFSGRAVITPDPTLSIDECKLPYIMILEIYKLPIAKRILELGKFKLLNKAIDFVNDCIDKGNPILYKICEQIIDGEYCILNRQPSLHKLSMLGFKIKMTIDNVIKIHPLVCSPFNADFDGDQMAVYIPITNEAKEEIINKISIVNNLTSPSNENLTTIPSQDIILGIYYLTAGKAMSNNKVMFKDIEMTLGEVEFNKQLPETYPGITGIVDSKRLMNILNDVKDNWVITEVTKTLDNIKLVGFKYATIVGCTMSLDDFSLDKARQIRDEVYSIPQAKDQLYAISRPEILNDLKSEFNYSYMIESGARGSWDQVKQLILSRGFISNFNGEILTTPIKNSLVDGLTPEEFFYSTYGCRKGLLDVALNTGTSGYLSRKLIFTCANLQLDTQLDDCGTTDTLPVNVNSERKARMLINRYQNVNNNLEKITIENYKDNIGKTIFIRSPILCKSDRICKKCYGDLYQKLNSRFIGILAAQTLGERGTQLVLRTFHTSGSAITNNEEDASKQTMKQKDIIGDLASVSQLLHKFKGKTYVGIVDELFNVYDKDISHIHFECVVAQLMWNGHKKWRLLPNRDQVQPEYYSIQSVPNRESWILAMAFSNPKKSILHGIMYEGRYSGVMDKILKGEKIT